MHRVHLTHDTPKTGIAAIQWVLSMGWSIRLGEQANIVRG